MATRGLPGFSSCVSYKLRHWKIPLNERAYWLVDGLVGMVSLSEIFWGLQWKYHSTVSLTETPRAHLSRQGWYPSEWHRRQTLKCHKKVNFIRRVGYLWLTVFSLISLRFYPSLKKMESIILTRVVRINWERRKELNLCLVFGITNKWQL